MARVKWWGVLVVCCLLAACSSRSTTPRPAEPNSSGYVDGIRIPTPQPTTAAPVVPAPTSCPAAWRRIVARSEPGATVTVQAQTSSNLLTCAYRNRPATGCSGVTVTVNTQPDALLDFNRWTVEQGQNSMWGHNPSLQPRPVSGVGIEAEWAPGALTFETATTSVWVAVFLYCATHSARQEPLAQELATTALASVS